MKNQNSARQPPPELGNAAKLRKDIEDTLLGAKRSYLIKKIFAAICLVFAFVVAVIVVYYLLNPKITITSPTPNAVVCATLTVNGVYRGWVNNIYVIAWPKNIPDTGYPNTSPAVKDRIGWSWSGLSLGILLGSLALGAGLGLIAGFYVQTKRWERLWFVIGLSGGVIVGIALNAISGFWFTGTWRQTLTLPAEAQQFKIVAYIATSQASTGLQEYAQKGIPSAKLSEMGLKERSCITVTKECDCKQMTEASIVVTDATGKDPHPVDEKQVMSVPQGKKVSITVNFKHPCDCRAIEWETRSRSDQEILKPLDEAETNRTQTVRRFQAVEVGQVALIARITDKTYREESFFPVLTIIVKVAEQ